MAADLLAHLLRVQAMLRRQPSDQTIERIELLLGGPIMVEIPLEHDQEQPRHVAIGESP